MDCLHYSCDARNTGTGRKFQEIIPLFILYSLHPPLSFPPPPTDYYSSSTREKSYFLGLSNDALIPYLSGGYGVGGVGAESRDDAIARATRATEVLAARDPITWKWSVVVSLLKWSVNSQGEEAGGAGGERCVPLRVPVYSNKSTGQSVLSLLKYLTNAFQLRLDAFQVPTIHRKCFIL